MNIIRKSLLLLFTFAMLSSCHSQNNNGSILNVISNPKDDLVGDFSTTEKGKVEIRITKQSGNYFVTTPQDNSWTNPEQLMDVKDQDFAQLFGNGWKEYIEAGLTAGSFGIFKVKKGYQTKDHTFTTGYFMVLLSGGDIYKL